MEVAAGEHRLVVGEDERIVRAGVELHREHAAQVVDGVVARAVHLGGATQGIRVLHAIAEHVRFGDATALGHGKDAGGRGNLAGMRPRRVDARIEGGTRTAQGLDTERRHHVGGQQEPLRIVEHQAGGSGHEVRAVEHAQRILGPQLDGLYRDDPVDRNEILHDGMRASAQPCAASSRSRLTFSASDRTDLKMPVSSSV